MIRRKMRFVVCFPALLLQIVVFPVLAGCAPPKGKYSLGWERTVYPSITGRVVDGETGEPIEGAVLLCLWTKTKGIPGLSSPYLENVVETISNKEGRFLIEGTLDPFLNPPDLTVYKRDYAAWNNKEIFPTFEKRKDFQWKDGLVIEMEKWKKGYSYIDHYSFISIPTDSSALNIKNKDGAFEYRFFQAIEWETDFYLEELRKKHEMRKEEGGQK